MIMRCHHKQDSFSMPRQRMLNRDLRGRGITDQNVLKAMEQTPREEFVAPELQSQAYSDGPLSIGLGQTISQPYIVALMTEELRVRPDSQILEIGTGSGYQTAILSKLAEKVYTIERLEELSRSAQAVLAKLGISNVEFYIGDGSCGWPEEKSFDGIIVTAGIPSVQGPLLQQLAEDGILIAPVGGAGVQRLMAYEKKMGKIIERFICDVRFVKLIGQFGFQE